MNKFLLESGNWLIYLAPFIPLVVGLITKATLSSKLKAFTMIIVNGLAALAYQVESGGGILTKEMAAAWGFGIVVSAASYAGVWKPLGATSDTIAPKAGLG